MKLLDNKDFFTHTENNTNTQPVRSFSGCDKSNLQEHKSTVLPSSTIGKLAKQSSTVLRECGFEKMASNVERIYTDARRERFVISVVGEFNRGKSTFINNLLGNPLVLPVGDLPTTAVLTRIRYSKQEKMAVFDNRGNRTAILEIGASSWQGLTANNFGEDQPEGSIIIGLSNDFIGRNNIEIIDCPGAGDLSETRSKQIGDALNRSDGAIIAIDATRPLSRTEQIFIKNRIIGRNTPYTLIVINKLDLIKESERNQIITYIKQVLDLNKIAVPIYVPYDIDTTDDTYKDIIGMDKVITAIEGWTNSENRQYLIDIWVKSHIREIVTQASEILGEQETLFIADEKKRTELLAEKIIALDKLALAWGDMNLSFQKDSVDCYNSFIAKVNEYTSEITEKLQYEASHTLTPERWWKEDYPYRLKIELASLSVSLENYVSKRISVDAKKLNDQLTQRFKTFVTTGDHIIADKDEYKQFHSTKKIEFEDINKKQNIARVGTVAISLALAPVFGIVATMGVGTAGTLLSNSFTKKRLEEQKQELKEAISRDIPNIILQATSSSKSRIRAIYDDIFSSAEKQKEAWYEAQKVAVETATPSHDEEKKAELAKKRDQLNEIIKFINI